jgi:uncharacterized membrane protein YebE (DUF533 family)
MRHKLTRIAAAFVTAAAFAVTAPAIAVAQSAEQQMPQPNGEIESDFSDEVLLAYVAAAQSVGEVVMSYRQKVQNAGSEEEASALQEEARATAMQQIESTPGMDLETYKQVSAAVQQDPDLLQKLRGMAQEQQQQ